MTYSPKNENQKPLLITIILTAISVFCFVYAGHFPKITWLMQLGFVIFATTAIQIYLRFVLTQFEYCCDDEFLLIYKSVGKRKQLIGKLELINSGSYLISDKEYSENKDDYKIKSEYNYTRNFKTQNGYNYVTVIGETNFLVRIEADDEFATYVNKRIDDILKGQKNNDEI